MHSGCSFTMNETLYSPIRNNDKQSIERAKPSCHRRYEPKYSKRSVNIPIARRLEAILRKWDPNKCQFMTQLRRNGGSILMRVHNDGTKRYKMLLPRRLSIRVEREQTIRCLLKAILNNVEYSPNATFLFECMSSIEELAKQIGQLHEYEPGYDATEDSIGHRHGRKAYDPVLGALDDLEAAGLMLVVRGWDKETKQYKASRIFLMPKLFQSLGMTAKETKYLLAGKAKAERRAEKQFKRSRPYSENMASIDNQKLLSLLNYNKRWFNGEFEDQPEKEKLAKDFINSIKPDAVSPEQEFRLLDQQTPRIIFITAEQAIKESHPNIDRLEYIKLVTNRLRH